ncbi:YjbH domain-containing protein, partial [Leclercia adecarboxylata]
DFDQLFDFRDYEVTAGHVSAYYEFTQGFTAQPGGGPGRAGDPRPAGAPARRFGEGRQTGGSAHKAGLAGGEFRGGSFDKGVTLSVPLGWATGQASRDRVSTNIRSLSRDGGSRVNVNGRLYD